MSVGTFGGLSALSIFPTSKLAKALEVDRRGIEVLFEDS